MTSSIGNVGLFAKADDSALKGIRRSRISLHLRTHRVRHWVLVQFVSVPVPVEEAHEDHVEKAVRSAQRQERLRSGMDRITNEYQMIRPARMWM
jgi:hypothetical protein